MSDKPLILEASLSPIRFLGEKQIFTNQQLTQFAKDCFAAGVNIVHHHHNYDLDAAGTAAEFIELGKAVIAEYPDAICYGDYTRSKDFDGSVAHLPYMHEAGTLRMVPIEPGSTLVGGLRDDGEPYTVFHHHISYEDANKLTSNAKGWRVPVTIGIMEPGAIRWAVAQAARGALPPGSMVKFYLTTDVDSFNHNRKGMNYGLPPTKAAVDACVEMLGDSGLPWIVSVFGGVINEMPVCRYIMEKGGHVRTGVEDACGNTSLTSAELVADLVAMANQVGRPLVKQSDTLEVLGAKRFPIAA